MNKLIIAAIIFSSCNSNTEVVYTDDVPFSDVEHFAYKGHKYIKFTSSRCGMCGVVHDPDCKCNNHK